MARKKTKGTEATTDQATELQALPIERAGAPLPDWIRRLAQNQAALETRVLALEAQLGVEVAGKPATSSNEK